MRFKNLSLVTLSLLLLLPALDATAGRRQSLLQRLKHRRERATASWSRPCCCCCPSQHTAPADDVVSSEPAPAAVPSGDDANVAAAEPAAPAGNEDGEWRSLFNGKDLSGWKITQFGGEGDVDVENGVLRLGFGQYLTGVTYVGKNLPTNNYEIELEAMREEGFDFFCGLTFPVDDAHCSLIAGGWGGSVVGISSIDDMDASENETTTFMLFEPKKWYTIRVRVTPGLIKAWVNDKVIVDQDVAGRKLSTRIEVDLSIPMGIASFDTQAAIRNIRIRELAPDGQE